MLLKVNDKIYSIQKEDGIEGWWLLITEDGTVWDDGKTLAWLIGGQVDWVQNTNINIIG